MTASLHFYHQLACFIQRMHIFIKIKESKISISSKQEEEGKEEKKICSSNIICHLILLKGQQLEIKTKFEINEAHSGGGIHF